MWDARTGKLCRDLPLGAFNVGPYSGDDESALVEYSGESFRPGQQIADHRRLPRGHMRLRQEVLLLDRHRVPTRDEARVHDAAKLHEVAYGRVRGEQNWNTHANDQYRGR
jgi:hypothetical protein